VATAAVTVRALTAFQSAYNYADLLAEQPDDDPVGNARRLHEALRLALDFEAASSTCDESLWRDGGYMAQMVRDCRRSLRALPSHRAVAAPARRALDRLVAFQGLIHGEPDDFERWARMLPSSEGELEWWEAAAAAGSSLGIYALIAAAAAPSVSARHLAAIEDAYFPWTGALNSLLDSLVDEAEDAAAGQLSLVNCYSSRQAAAARVGWLAERMLEAVRRLPDGRRQAVLVVAMSCNYLSTPEASRPLALELASGVRAAIGGLAAPALLIFRMRRLASHLARAPPVARWADAGPQPSSRGEGRECWSCVSSSSTTRCRWRGGASGRWRLPVRCVR